ncbi:hypothetical protein NIES37_38320 [Tolypothrix tenuis PCC 7101]|uniref:Phthiocerol/phthiodiolone dimycocerosyl transferase n=2 Tax=Tolypothrix TaxID=111782 RepID=A0A1Z4N2A3_9CYAN|nr:hypothetical protein [Aulosira sp. FACHB-113]BAY99849.1 hypothetical protein NIES37_38320 [Tolypothrix tenuis PCC 7101]BAZ76229.1 hypothetical protein NIES50_48270 [Aulosira laxa NIES-50]
MLRQLGIEERIFWLHDQAIPLHFTMAAKVIGELQVDSLQQALAWVQQRHPLLGVRIVLDSLGNPWFTEDSATIPLRVVQRQSEQQWQQEVEQELAHPFNWNQAPLIRIVLVHAADCSELIITCHHAIADGMSVVYLLRDILQAVGIPGSQQQILPERPAYEYLTPIAHKIKPPTKDSQLELVNPSQTIPPAKSLHFRLLTWSLSPEETATVILRCRQAQTSVHAAICAAFLLAIAQSHHSQNDTEAQSLEQKQPVTLNCLTAINIRQFLTPPIQEDFGYYFTSNISAHTITPNLSLWDLAHVIKAQLNQKMSPDQIFAHLPEAQAFITSNPSIDTIKDIFQELYRYDVLVSNLGKLHIPTQYGHLQLAAIYGPSGAIHVAKGRFIGVATLGDQMFFNLLYPDSNISLTEIEHLQKKTMQLLLGESMEQVQLLSDTLISEDKRSLSKVK